MSFNFCTSGAIIRKAGANANSTIVASGAALAEWSDFAEGVITAETRRDWITSFSSLNTGIQNALADTASDLAAMKVVTYDMSGYTSRTEAQTILDVLRDNATRNLNILKDFKSNEIRSV